MRLITSASLLFKPLLALFAGLAVANAATAANVETISGADAGTQAKAIKYGINWVNSLSNAEELAKRSHKPIFWMHMLGNIDGYT
jgi:hypothetical protein